MNYKKAAIELWHILDYIDTASDIAKGNMEIYERIVERQHKKRFDIFHSDGYSLFDENGDVVEFNAGSLYESNKTRE
jgi:hypothetical protein